MVMAFHMIQNLRFKKWQRIIKESNLFEENFYLQNYPDVRDSKQDPIWHYLKHGAFEGRNPSKSFDTNFYLMEYRDVIIQLINPLVHYILFGRNEGRKTISEKITQEETKTPKNKQNSVKSKEYQTIKAEFDEEYYALNIGKIDKNIDLVEHYMCFGWKNGYNPNRYFDTIFYLQANPDIAASGINPFLHYLQHGKIEGRLCKHPAGYKKEILDRAIPLNELSRTWKRNDPNLLDEQILKNKLLTLLERPLVISLSHDRFNENVGGVQTCILDEQNELNNSGINHINISPVFSLPILADKESFWCGDLIINGKYFGAFTADNILCAFGNILNNIKQNMFLVVHALHGHNIEFLKRINKLCKFDRSFFWLHDYFSICNNHNLLRNNLEYCGAPKENSQACSICVHGGPARTAHCNMIEELFNEFSFTILAPSKTANTIWLQSTKLQFDQIIIHGHRILKKSTSIHGARYQDDQPLKIAYLGHAVTHKGWNLFKELVEIFKNDPRYAFYHLGTNESDKSCPAKFYEVKNNKNNLDAMMTSIKHHEIHCAFLWSLWPETYNLITYEALAAGSIILTNGSSGNIADEVRACGQGIVFESEEIMFELFRTGGIIDFVKSNIKKGLIHGALLSSKITSNFIVHAGD